jgi:hypothetical protein
MTLPADVARCLGTDLPECKTCRRRTDPPHERASVDWPVGTGGRAMRAKDTK